MALFYNYQVELPTVVDVDMMHSGSDRDPAVRHVLVSGAMIHHV
jgi:hypothetical protein